MMLLRTPKLFKALYIPIQNRTSFVNTTVPMLDSTYYVELLSTNELSNIRAYLNIDMIASPDYIYAIYDGDGSAFNITGPAGSAEIEHFFEAWFADNGLNSAATAFYG